MAIGRRRHLATLGALLLVATLAMTACAKEEPQTSTPSGTKVSLVKAGALTVCTSLPYAPFQSTIDGKVQGFDVSMIDLVAAKLGVTQEIVDIDFKQIKGGAALEAGTCDLAAAGMTITDERKQHLTFSDPYYDETLAFITPKGEKIMTIEEVKAKNLKLGVQASTTSLDYATEAGLDPQQFDDAGKQLEALKSGKIDVVLQDYPVVTEWLKKTEISASYELGGVIKTGSQYGFGLKKAADAELLKTVNAVIAESHTNGKYDELYKLWIGELPTPSGS